MADLNTFIDELGKDVTDRYVPEVATFIHTLGEQIAADAAPQVEAFVNTLVKQIFAKQSDPIRKFLTDQIKDLAARYHPEVSGNLTTRIVENGIEIASTDTRLDLKDSRDNVVITSLDIPIRVTIDVKQFLVKINSAGGQLRNLDIK